MFGLGKKKEKVEPDVLLIPPLETPPAIVDEDGNSVDPDLLRAVVVEYYSGGMMFAFGHHTRVAGAIVERNWTAKSLGSRLYRILSLPTPGGPLDLDSPVLPAARENLGTRTALEVRWAPHGEGRYSLVIYPESTSDAAAPAPVAENELAISVPAEELGRRVIEILGARPAELPVFEPLPEALHSPR